MIYFQKHIKKQKEKIKSEFGDELYQQAISYISNIDSGIAFVMHYGTKKLFFNGIIISNSKNSELFNNWKRIKSSGRGKFKSRRIEDKIHVLINHETMHLILFKYIGYNACKKFDNVDAICGISEFNIGVK